MDSEPVLPAKGTRSIVPAGDWPGREPQETDLRVGPAEAETGFAALPRPEAAETDSVDWTGRFARVAAEIVRPPAKYRPGQALTPMPMRGEGSYPRSPGRFSDSEYATNNCEFRH